VADPSTVLQILINLLRNAHDAVKSAPQPRIIVRMRLVAADRFTIEVADSGSGIASEHLDQIFNHAASSTGTGKGATFVLELPTRAVAGGG
jgi:C4-dicarboxylate-specific signal transduction histidine kinase